MSACGGQIEEKTYRTFTFDLTSDTREDAPLGPYKERIARWPDEQATYPCEVRFLFSDEEGEDFDFSERVAPHTNITLSFPGKASHLHGPEITKTQNVAFFKWEGGDEWQGPPHFHIEGDKGGATVRACNLLSSLTVMVRAGRGGGVVARVRGVIEQSYLKSAFKGNSEVEFVVQENQCPHLRTDPKTVQVPDATYALFSAGLRGGIGLTSTPERKERKELSEASSQD